MCGSTPCARRRVTAEPDARRTIRTGHSLLISRDVTRAAATTVPW